MYKRWKIFCFAYAPPSTDIGQFQITGSSTFRDETSVQQQVMGRSWISVSYEKLLRGRMENGRDRRARQQQQKRAADLSE